MTDQDTKMEISIRDFWRLIFLAATLGFIAGLLVVLA